MKKLSLLLPELEKKSETREKKLGEKIGPTYTKEQSSLMIIPARPIEPVKNASV